MGAEGLESLAGDADVVLNAVVGFAGVPVTLAALRAGRRLALANKESLIVAAPLVAAVRATPGASAAAGRLRALRDAPVPRRGGPGARATPTCAGSCSPRRAGRSAAGAPGDLARATEADALTHPTWSMGPKITIDSSTLMNKGLEVLEAAALFGVGVDRVDVVVHPQSIVHSMVEFVDGSILAQLSRPDMRLPIAYCLGSARAVRRRLGRDRPFDAPLELTFEPPDTARSSRPRPRLRGGAAAAARRRRG